MDVPSRPHPICEPGNAPDGGARRFVLVFIGTTLVGLAGLAALNVLADPYGAFGVALTPADSRTGETRTARAEMLRRYTGETVLIGTSRTRIGYDGSLACVPGGPACNLGLDGTHLRELIHVVECAVRNQHVRRIVLSLDLHLAAREWQPNPTFPGSRFNPERSGWEHWCDLLWNGRVVEASLRSIRRSLRGRPLQHDAYGFAQGAAERFRHVSQSVRAGVTIDSLCLRGMPLDVQPEEETQQQLEAIFAACEQHGIELTVVLDPVHALLLEGMRQRGDWGAYQRWKGDVVALADRHGARVWDFTGYTEWTSEPLLSESAAESRWFWEPSHMRRELGDLVLARIFGASSADPAFGTLLTPNNLPQSWARLERDRNDWIRRHTVELAALAELLHAGQLPGESGRIPAQLAEEPGSTAIR